MLFQDLIIFIIFWDLSGTKGIFVMHIYMHLCKIGIVCGNLAQQTVGNTTGNNGAFQYGITTIDRRYN